ncbi:hypothetical protein ACSERW_08645 [Pseudomonas aeruginosa]
MFWKKDKVVRIELLSPPVVVAASTQAEGTDASRKPGSFLLSTEQALKLAAIMIAALNTALVVLGYMRYVGLLQQFGVSRTEVSFTFSDLLSFGYVGFLNMTLSGQFAVAAVASAITLPVIAVVVRLKKELHSVVQFLLAWTVSTALFFAVTAPYWIAFNPGKEGALHAAAESMKLDKTLLRGLETEHEVTVEGGSITGKIILASPDMTYLLKANVIYKIRASDGKILRKTHLRPQMAGPSE